MQSQDTRVHLDALRQHCYLPPRLWRSVAIGHRRHRRRCPSTLSRRRRRTLLTSPKGQRQQGRSTTTILRSTPGAPRSRRSRCARLDQCYYLSPPDHHPPNNTFTRPLNLPADAVAASLSFAAVDPSPDPLGPVALPCLEAPNSERCR